MYPLQFGRYLLEKRLAVGGTAEVFKAQLLGPKGFSKTVALKRILPHWTANQQFISMLAEEALLMVRLNHPGIVQVYEFGQEGEDYFIAMEFVDGVDLRTLLDKISLRQKNLPFFLTLFIISEVLKGLHFIHSQKDENGKPLEIIHRDISPQNILISRTGSVKIADFGIAHAASRSYQTSTGAIKGKFAYMSPEQASGGILSQQTDLFAVGILFYEMLTGKRLFQGSNDLQTLEKLKKFDPDSDLDLQKLPPPLQPILRQALRPPLKERTSSAENFLSALEQIEGKISSQLAQQELALEIDNLLREEDSSKETSIKKETTFSPPSSKTIIFAENENFRKIATQAEEIATRTFEYEIKKVSFLKKPSFWGKVWLAVFCLMLGILLIRSDPMTEKFSILKEKIQTGPLLSAKKAIQKEFLIKIETVKKNESGKEISKTDSEKIKKPEEKEETNKKGEGMLRVSAHPWGKISVGGVIQGAERPISQKVKYGSYSLSVAYRGLSGEWNTLSRNVKVSKASTSCVATFQPDGKGSISCN